MLMFVLFNTDTDQQLKFQHMYMLKLWLCMLQDSCDLYILYNETGIITPLITYDWFPQTAKNLSLISKLPVFPEDYAYYLLNDNETLIMISGVKSIRSNFKFNLINKNLEKLPLKNKYKLFVSSLLKDCGYKDINSTYKCSYYKPLISSNLVN